MRKPTLAAAVLLSAASALAGVRLENRFVTLEIGDDATVLRLAAKDTGAETRERIQNKPLLQPEVSRDEVAKTTRYRVRIPFVDLAPLKPEKGRVFGFTFLVFDYDPPATGHCQLRLSAGASTPFDPSLFKKFMFE